MPEGDTIYRAAARVRAGILGEKATDVWGSARDMRRFADRLRSMTITEVTSRGKHHLITFDERFVIRTHMGMTGTWRVHAPGEPWKVSRGKARVVIETERSVAVCFSAPDVQISSKELIEERLSGLGPDLLGSTFEAAEAVARSYDSAAMTISDLLLDQTVMAGVGNVYKCELLFLAGLHPELPTAAVDAESRLGLVESARELLVSNKDRARRVTTGDPRKGQGLFVYGRARRNCRRCGTGIVSSEVGDPRRVTYWCPRCQTR